MGHLARKQRFFFFFSLLKGNWFQFKIIKLDSRVQYVLFFMSHVSNLVWNLHLWKISNPEARVRLWHLRSFVKHTLRKISRFLSQKYYCFLSCIIMQKLLLLYKKFKYDLQ